MDYSMYYIKTNTKFGWTKIYTNRKSKSITQTLFSGDTLEMKTSSQRQGATPHPTAVAAMEMWLRGACESAHLPRLLFKMNSQLNIRFTYYLYSSRIVSCCFWIQWYHVERWLTNREVGPHTHFRWGVFDFRCASMSTGHLWTRPSAAETTLESTKFWGVQFCRILWCPILPTSVASLGTTCRPKFIETWCWVKGRHRKMDSF